MAAGPTGSANGPAVIPWSWQRLTSTGRTFTLSRMPDSRARHEEKQMPTGESLKQRIHSGEVVVALRVSITIDRGQLETALARGTYDLLYIDGQHTAFSDDQLVAFCAMAEDLDLPVQFRIPHTRHTYLIGRYLDLGPTAILVPEVADQAAVDEAVAFTYYPPDGRRSWGGTARRGVRERAGRVEYAEW